MVGGRGLDRRQEKRSRAAGSFTEGDGREGRSVDPSLEALCCGSENPETPPVLSVTVSRRLGPLRRHRQSSR